MTWPRLCLLNSTRTPDSAFLCSAVAQMSRKDAQQTRSSRLFNLDLVTSFCCLVICVWLCDHMDCDHMDCSTPGFPVLHHLPELAQTHVHRVGEAIQPLLSPSPPAFNISQHQGLFQWVSSSHQVAKVLEFQLQHQSFQRIFRTDFF